MNDKDFETFITQRPNSRADALIREDTRHNHVRDPHVLKNEAQVCTRQGAVCRLGNDNFIPLRREGIDNLTVILSLGKSR